VEHCGGLEVATRLPITDYARTEFIKEDSPFCLTHAISRTMIGPCLRSVWFRGMLPEDVPMRRRVS